ncbi:MAG TPA: sigma factor [Verrucomicrobiales bacterium]|nr:sigma factor [Verrucomicrobiales bacterium]
MEDQEGQPDPGFATQEGPQAFPPTRWTLLLEMQEDSETTRFRALSELCRIYWYPIYAFVRRKGYRPADAEDFTQEFFRRLLAHDSLVAVDRSKGRLRSYLLTSVSRLITEDWRKRSAQKRGGGSLPVSIEAAAAEHRYALEPAESVTPEHLFERRWALAILDEAHGRIAVEYARLNRSKLFEALEDCLLGEAQAVPYAEVARRVNLTEGSVKVAAFRLRKRFRELIREEISHTVDDSADVESELQYLFRLLA